MYAHGLGSQLFWWKYFCKTKGIFESAEPSLMKRVAYQSLLFSLNTTAVDILVRSQYGAKLEQLRDDPLFLLAWPAVRLLGADAEHPRAAETLFADAGFGLEQKRAAAKNRRADDLARVA